jgi:N-formylglutamate amidohydrolase
MAAGEKELKRLLEKQAAPLLWDCHSIQTGISFLEVVPIIYCL